MSHLLSSEEEEEEDFGYCGNVKSDSRANNNLITYSESERDVLLSRQSTQLFPRAAVGIHPQEQCNTVDFIAEKTASWLYSRSSDGL